MSYTCGGKRTFDLTNNPIRSVFQEPEIPLEKRLDYYRGLLNDDFEVKTDQQLTNQTNSSESKQARDEDADVEEGEVVQTNKRQRIVSDLQSKPAVTPTDSSGNAIVFCKECPYHCPANPFRLPNQPPQQPLPTPLPQPQPLPTPLPQPPQPLPNIPVPIPDAPARQQGPLPPPPQPLPGQKTVVMKFPTSYLGDVDLRVIPRGNGNYELIQDTAGLHARPLILKIVDSRQIRNFNPDNPPGANELATMPPKIINMEVCQRYRAILQALRYKINRTASEEVMFYEALCELGGIDLLFLMSQYFAFLKEFCGIENISNNDSMFLVAVSNIPNFDNAFAFYNSFYCGDGKTQFYPLCAPDVTNHELNHLVVARLSGLVYQGHSGAINEGFADCLALFGERWLYMKFNEDHDQTNDLLGSWNYTIGEACGRRLRIMRNFKNPLDAPQKCPAQYQGEAYGDPNADFDYGNVHGNSSIVNKCVYECIQSVGWNIAGKLVFATLKKMRPNSSFVDFRDALKASASELNCLDQIRICLNTVNLTDTMVNDWVPKKF